jgi:predicted transcriptional regulator
VESIELQLDEQTARRLRELARARNRSVENFVRDLLADVARGASERDPLWGLFSDEPELMDQVLAAAMAAREEHTLRHH